MALSPYPFNQDSLLEASVARGITETGGIALPWQHDSTVTHSESTPLYNLLLAFAASTLGVDPVFAVQWVVAAVSVLLVLTAYVLLVSITGDVRAALAGAFFIGLFGTMVYVTASGWKISLGISLWVLLVYAYSQRQRRGMKLVVILLLLVLPFVHHLAAIVGYMSLAFLVSWSWVYAVIRGNTTKRHFEELFVLLIMSVVALGYYYAVSFDRLEYIGSFVGVLFLGASTLVAFLAAIAGLLKKSHVRVTFAPLPAVLILAVSVLDYNGFVFDYVPSTTFLNYFLIAVASAVMIFLGWYGLECIIESESRFRAIPLGLLLPPITLIFFALVSPSVENKHQLIYRTFDLADPAIGVGIGLAFFALFTRPNWAKVAPAVMAIFLSVLLATLPFGIYTHEFTGVRHDTQPYEIELVDWMMAGSQDVRYDVCTDERLAYVVWALYGLGMNNSLPSMLQNNNSLAPGVFYVYEEFWSVDGVNDYPNGVVTVSSEFVDSLMQVENVIYVGGPSDNRAVVWVPSWIGETRNNWVPLMS